MQRNAGQGGRPNGGQPVGAAQAEAELAFPNEVAGKLAQPVAVNAPLEAKPTILLGLNEISRLLVGIFKVTIALALSCGGLVMLLGVLAQAVPTQAQPLQITLPQHAALCTSSPEATQRENRVNNTKRKRKC